MPQGLPTDWVGGDAEGTYSTGGVLPTVSDNTRLHVYSVSTESNSHMFLLHDIPLKQTCGGVEEDAGYPLDVVHCSDGKALDLLAITASDMTLSFWDCSCYKMGDRAPPR